MPGSLVCIPLGNMPSYLNCAAPQIICDVKCSTKNYHVICFVD